MPRDQARTTNRESNIAVFDLFFFAFCILRSKIVVSIYAVIFHFVEDPSSGEIKTEVCAICSTLPFYGVPDLAEILGN